LWSKALLFRSATPRHTITGVSFNTNGNYIVSHALNIVSSDTKKVILTIETATGNLVSARSYLSGVNYFKFNNNLLMDSNLNVYVGSLFSANILTPTSISVQY
jgi:hypothetical protein